MERLLKLSKQIVPFDQSQEELSRGLKVKVLGTSADGLD